MNAESARAGNRSRAGIDSDRDFIQRSRSARAAAEASVDRDLMKWWSAEKAKLDADESLSPQDFRAARMALAVEFSRRRNRARERAKRANRPAAILERDAREQVEREEGGP